MIVHIDMDAFYASVEICDNPDLKGLPVVVGGSPTGRGVISAASYEARKFGIHSAMPASRALRLCPNAVFIKPRMERYSVISKQIREIFFRFTSLVEPLSMDEAFLDVSGSEGLFGPAADIARQIKRTILNEAGLIASAGVASNKFLAKVASDLDKPDGFVLVEEGTEQAFLDPLPIYRVWGIGKKTQEKFASIGVTRIAHLRSVPKSVLSDMFGVNSEHFWRLARGLDTRAVVPDRNAKSISHENTFSHDIHSEEALRAWMSELADQVARRLRRHSIFGKTVQLKLRYSDFQTITRSQTLPEATQSTREIRETVFDLFNAVNLRSCGIRLLGVGVSNLSNSQPQQQMLFDQPERERDKRLDNMADSIKEKFGSSAIQRGTNLEHRIRHRPDPRLDE